MNPTEILRRAKELKDHKRVKLLWFLQSLALQDCGDEKFATDLKGHFPERHARLMKSQYWGFASDPDPINAKDELFKQVMGDDATCPEATALLLEYMRLTESDTKRRFHLTNIGSKVWETLDWCQEERRPCFIEGFEGRGKTSAARAWHESHRGESRYVSLPGLRTQRDFFEAIATAYGVNFSSAKAPNEIRFRLRDMIVRSGLILILDEAHHALPERHRAGRPALIDWIDCDLCNAGVPVVLVSTPQFGPSLAEFADRTKWNAGQFRRRFSGRWTCLPVKTSRDDLVTLAEQAMPKVGSKGLNLAVGYAGTFGRDVSGLFDLVRDAERRARKANHPAVTYQDLRAAYDLDRVPCENAMANSFKRPILPRPSAVEDTLPESSEPAAATLQRGILHSESEFTAPDRGLSAPLLATH